MANFYFKELKIGFEGKIKERFLSITDIQFFEDDVEVIIPSEYEGKKVECVGYYQGKKEGYAKFHDWHHPSQGYDEIVPNEYYCQKSSFIIIPKNVKKFIFPNTIKYINRSIFNDVKRKIIFEFEEGSPYTTDEKGKIVPIENN